MNDITPLRQLSPLRNSTCAANAQELSLEQLAHFGIDVTTPYGEALATFARHLYQLNVDAHTLWSRTLETIEGLDRSDRITYFNAKRFLCFQLAKVLDTLQNPMRMSY
ncbi:MAG: Cys/Met metabolism pyridoxal-phosphate-dependent enzyme, partial [Pseudomonadota bacterium]